MIKKSNNAFTLIELLVVVSIIGFLTVAIFIDSGAPKKVAALSRAAREMTIAIRDAQNKSIATVVGSNSIYPCGFGMHYKDDDEVILYRESTSPAGETCSATTTPGVQHQNIDRLYQEPGGYGVDVILETIRLTETNLVKLLSGFDDIYFEPPDGLTYINGVHNNQTASSTDISFCLRENCSEYQKTIRVYLGGNVEITD